MDRTISRVELDIHVGAQKVSVTGFGTFLSAKYKDDKIHVWIEHASGADFTDSIEFIVYGTGQTIKEVYASHLCTVFDEGRNMVWHLYRNYNYGG